MEASIDGKFESAICPTLWDELERVSRRPKIASLVPGEPRRGLSPMSVGALAWRQIRMCVLSVGIRQTTTSWRSPCRSTPTISSPATTACSRSRRTRPDHEPPRARGPSRAAIVNSSSDLRIPTDAELRQPCSMR